MVREVKVNGASGGPGSGKEGACRPAARLLGGEARLVVPLTWPRRQPDFCRERNRRQRRFVVEVVFAGCTPGRSPVGLRLPGEGNNQPRRRRVRCTYGPGSEQDFAQNQAVIARLVSERSARRATRCTTSKDSSSQQSRARRLGDHPQPNPSAEPALIYTAPQPDPNLAGIFLLRQLNSIADGQSCIWRTFSGEARSGPTIVAGIFCIDRTGPISAIQSTIR